MKPIGRLARNRDIALTTLIDLLVQVVFVFTLILVSAEVIEAARTLSSATSRASTTV